MRTTRSPSAELFERDVVRAAFCERLTSFAQVNTGHSTRVARLILLEDPPSIDAQETTDKGSVNQKSVLTNRAAGSTALRRRQSGNRHQSRHGRPAERSRAQGPRERRRCPAGEAPAIYDHRYGKLTAIDVHVHLEAPDRPKRRAARKYPATRAPAAACLPRRLPFSEARLRGVHGRRAAVRTPAGVERRRAGVCLGEFRHRHSVRQRRSDAGPGSDPGSRRLVDTGLVRGLKPIHRYAVLPERSHRLPMRDLRQARLPVLFHTGHSGIGTGAPAAPDPPEMRTPDADRRRGRGLS